MNEQNTGTTPGGVSVPPSPPASILVVDDEPAITGMLAAMLVRSGHLPTTINDPTKVLSMNLDGIDLMLVDVMMPRLDGYELMRHLRGRVDCPILFLTAKTSEQDALMGYDLGADDYIRKPFSKAELIAKVNAHLARARHEWRNTLVLGDYRFDHNANTLSYQGHHIPLTSMEYDICAWLATHRGSVQDKRTLEAMLYTELGGQYACSSQVLPVHISNIRGKFRQWNVNPIRTVRAFGYQWIGC